MPRPMNALELKHIALFSQHFEACEYFYTKVLGLKIVWRPDADNLYLSSGTDNIALHRAPQEFSPEKFQRLDHFGFFVPTAQAVDEWYDYLKEQQVVIKAAPKDHRDGTRSLYCADPDGNVIQLIYYPVSLHVK